MCLHPGRRRWPGQRGRTRHLPDEDVQILRPVEGDRTLYLWRRHRNTDPQDEGITQRIASGAKAAFEEDRLILEAVHQSRKHKTTPTTGPLLDAAASRFRQGLARLIAVEAGTQADSPAVD